MKFIRWFHNQAAQDGMLPVISTSKENLFTLQIGDSNSQVLNPIVIVHKIDCSMVKIQLLEHNSGLEPISEIWLWKGDPCFRNIFYYNQTKHGADAIPYPSIDLLKTFAKTKRDKIPAQKNSKKSSENAITTTNDGNDNSYPFELDSPLSDDEWLTRKRLRAFTPPPEYQ